MNPDTLQQIIEMATYGEKVMMLCPRGTVVDKVRKLLREQMEEKSFLDSFELRRDSLLINRVVKYFSM